MIRTATQRAMNYAINRGVTPVAAEGNEATDLGHPTIDETSPDFPPGSEKTAASTTAASPFRPRPAVSSR